jgi:ATP-dependent Zn protease
MKPLFEIRSQFGLARCGRINFGQMTFSTPHLLLPNESIFTQLFVQVIYDAHLDKDKFIEILKDRAKYITKTYKVESPNDAKKAVTFADVAGADEARKRSKR